MMRFRATLLASLALSLVTGLSAQQFDITIGSENAYYQAGESAYSFKDFGQFVFSTPLGANANFQADLSLRYRGYAAASGYIGTDPLYTLPCVNALYFGFPKLATEKTGLSDLRIGRFSYSDITGLVFSAPLDGLAARASFSGWDFDFGSGYTGLNWRSDSSIFISKADVLSASPLASPRVMAWLDLTTPTFANQRVRLGLVAQEDMTPDSGYAALGNTSFVAAGGGSIDTQYAALNVEGTIIKGLHYGANFVWGAGRELVYLDDALSPTGKSYQYSAIASCAGSANVDYALLPSLSLGVSALVASGDSSATDALDGNSANDATLFHSISYTSPSLIFAPQLGGLYTVDASVTYKPFPEETVGIRGLEAASHSYLFGKLGTGPVYAANVESDSGGIVGFEEDLSCSARLFSDFGLNATFAAFMPALYPAGAFAANASPFQFAIKIGAYLYL